MGNDENRDRAGAMGRAFFGAGSTLGVSDARESWAWRITLLGFGTGFLAALVAGLVALSLWWAVGAFVVASVAAFIVLSLLFPAPD